MALKPLNSVAGFSVGETPANIILANGDITTNNITTTGKANLNNISNVYIAGGSNTQVIQTDGLGNLSFVTISTSSLTNGSSNIQVLANSNITFSSSGNANILVISGSGANVTGYLTVNGNITANGNISANNYLVTPASKDLIIAPATNLVRVDANINPYNDATYTLGNNLARWANIYTGEANISGNANIGSVRTDNLLYANGNPWDLQQAAGANKQIQYNDGANNFGASANFTFDYATNLLTVNGNAQFNNANLGNLATANFANFTNNLVVQGNIANANNISVTNNITSNTANVTGNLTTGNANLGNLAVANNFSTNGTGGDITLTNGNIQGANVTFANSFTANGGVVNFTTSSNVSLGPVANLHISGGTAGYVLQTDGAGNLTWEATGSPSIIHNGNSNVSIPTIDGNVYINANAAVDQQWAFGTDGNLILPVGGVISEGTSPAGVGNTITLTPNGGTNVNQQLLIYPTITEGDHLHLTTGNLLQTSLFLGNDTQYIRTNTDGSMVIGTDDSQPDTPNLGYRWVFDVAGNLTAPSAGTANLGNLVKANNFATNGTGGDVTLTGGNVQGGNVVFANSFTSNGGIVDFNTNNPNVQLGFVDNVHIGGGSAGYVLATDGSGVLTWVATGTQSEIYNGDSNVTIPTTNGNVYINANGGTDRQWNFDTTGYLTTAFGGQISNEYDTGNTTGQLMLANAAGGYTGGLAGLNQGGGNNTIYLTDAGIQFYANSLGTEQYWHFDGSGNTSFPSTGTANLGNLAVANNVSGNHIQANNVGNTEVPYGNASNYLVSSSSFTYSSGTGILAVGNVSTGNVQVNSIANTYIAFANATNYLVGSTDFTFDAGTQTLNVGGNIVTGNGSGGNISGVDVLTANIANITTVVNTGAIANGTSNIRLATNGNITISSNNSSNVFTFSDMGANVIGYIQANGIISAGGFVGSNLVSNVGILSLSAQQGATAYNINLLAGGAGNIDVGGTYITSVKNPSSPQDAATKEYVDNISQGLFVHPPANVLASGNLTATYDNGGTVLSANIISGGTTITFSTSHGLVVNDDITFGASLNGLVAGELYFVYSVPASNQITIKNGYFGAQITTLTNGTGLSIPALGNGGVGATLTNSGANAALTIDSVLMTVGKRVLVIGQTNGFENGIYEVTTVGTVSVPWVLTRSSDGDSYQPKSSTALCSGSYFFISQGTNYAGSSYILTSPTGEISIGVDNIVFTQFSAAGAYTSGNGIAINGTVISANIDNTTTAIIGGNIAVANSAQLVTPNIGAATGTSLDLTGNVVAGNLNSNAAITAVSGSLTGNLEVGGSITTTGATGNISGANVIFATSFTANSGGNVDFYTNNPNVKLGNVANVHVYGGSASQVLVTDGTGNLSWSSAPNISIIQNGTSNVTIPTTNGNVVTNANGNATLTVTDIGANLTGYANISGNIFAPAIVQNASTYDTRVSLGSGTGIIAITSAGNSTQFAPSGQITLAGASQIVGGTFAGSGITLGTSQTDLFQNRGGNVTIQVGTGGSISNTWTFANNGNTSFPTGGTVQLGATAVANTVNVGTLTSITYGNVTTTAVTANQTIASLNVTGITGLEFLVKAIDQNGVANKYSVATVTAVTDGTDVDYAVFGTVQLGGYTGSLAVNVVGGYVRLQVTPASSNSTVWVTQARTV